MKRKFTDVLNNWKRKKNKLPLMLIGARQTGKTYVINDFCEKNYKNYIYINFDLKPIYQTFFDDDLDPHNIVERIERYIDKKIFPGSIIFFDEIQTCPKAISSLKYFAEFMNDIDIICAGSLLGVMISREKFSFPVGKVQFEKLYPLDFEEFLIALNREELVSDIRIAFNKDKALPESTHFLLLNLYNEYIYIGGMPASINDYILKNKDLLKYDKNIKNNIVTSYIADMSKYTSNSEAIKINAIYTNIPLQLAKENSKFVFKELQSNARYNMYEGALEWLIESGLVLKCNNIKIPQLPLLSYSEHTKFKLYLNDIGLLLSISKLDINDIINNKDMIYKGNITENYVAQNLVRNGYDLFYWSSKGEAELDFIIHKEGQIIPIEVKSSSNTKSKSLMTYVKLYNPSYSIRVSIKNFGFVNNIKSVPLYAVHLI